MAMAHVEDKLTAATGTAVHGRDASTTTARPLRRFAGWLSTLLADDGMSARFSNERQRDEGLVRRVEGRRRP
jgi:hypothetical protein